MLLMSFIRMLTVSPFLVPEPQDSSVQLPNCFMLQKVGCLLTKEKNWHFLPAAPNVIASYNIKASAAFLGEHYAAFSSFLSQKRLCSFSPLSQLSEGLYLLGLLCCCGAEAFNIVSTASMRLFKLIKIK